eukprot:UN33072
MVGLNSAKNRPHPNHPSVYPNLEHFLLKTALNISPTQNSNINNQPNTKTCHNINHKNNISINHSRPPPPPPSPPNISLPKRLQQQLHHNNNKKPTHRFLNVQQNPQYIGHQQQVRMTYTNNRRHNTNNSAPIRHTNNGYNHHINNQQQQRASPINNKPQPIQTITNNQVHNRNSPKNLISPCQQGHGIHNQNPNHKIILIFNTVNKNTIHLTDPITITIIISMLISPNK